MPQLIPDVLLLIFTELQEDLTSLYSCILVNRTWYSIAIRVLWKNLSKSYANHIPYNKRSLKILFNTISSSLSEQSIFLKNKVELSSSRPLYNNYMNFFTHISPLFVNDMVQLLTEDEEENYDNTSKDLLEEEIYKLIFNNCNCVKYFYWDTKHLLHSLPNARAFFANLHSLTINLTSMESKTLCELAGICRNIKNLKIKSLDYTNMNLEYFINAQTKLQSLYLHFGNGRAQCMSLCNAIKGKADTLKKITIKSSISTISPKFLPSLKKLQYIIINNDGGQFYNDDIWSEWKHYLDTTDFPELKYLEVSHITPMMNSFLLQKYSDIFQSISFSNDEHKLIFENNL
ncbi:hypothetical protein RclHR1_01270004 [Rhizophagus clarus]|uniref:F-box domain-containing protein n=1 Tax=Rhizophagus clarus TaxID=94130 RepID=A0A2Z6R083_9GLOM|nr:hypothetical protein RclHR1_01270004 [Rhizophagus clarus]GES82374.1 hypothetical protein GLOIN_2v1878600 [Rhizophagus clarus]